MQTHRKKRIEFIVEVPLAGRFTAIIDGEGATGYTVIPAIGGRGRNGPWRSEDVSGAFGRVAIIVVADAWIAERIVERAHALLRDYDAIVTVGDVEVVRGDRF